MKNFKIIGFLSFVFLTNTIIGQVAWTESDQANYMANKSDSTTWDMELLNQDVSFHLDSQWPTKSAISDYPSPVPRYDWGYGFIGSQEINLEGKVIHGVTMGYAKDKYRKHLLIDTADYYINYFNIFIWTDLEEDEAGACTIVSRNYPHYFSSGKQKTSMGSVDWMHMNMADGQNFAVINQRYYDLKYGKTILVKALKDGSLRIFQIKDDFGSISSDKLRERKDKGISNPLYEYLDRLSEMIEVKGFYNDGRMLLLSDAEN